MKRIAIDNNMIDVIAETPGLLEAIQAAGARQQLVIITTHVLEDEIERIPDQGRRTQLRAVYDALPKKQVATADFVIGKSRLGMARLSDGHNYECYIGDGKKENHAFDALVVRTAIQEADVLVTAEHSTRRNRLPRRLRRINPSFPIWDKKTFMAYVFSLAAPQPPAPGA